MMFWLLALNGDRIGVYIKSMYRSTTLHLSKPLSSRPFEAFPMQVLPDLSYILILMNYLVDSCIVLKMIGMFSTAIRLEYSLLELNTGPGFVVILLFSGNIYL